MKISPRLEMNPDAGGLRRGYAWMAKHYLRVLKLALAYRARQKRCPFCNEGFFVPSGTAGRMQCSNCNSQALDGRKAESRKIE